MKSQRSRSARIIGPLIGHANDSDELLVEGLHEQAKRADHSGRPFTEIHAQAFGVRKPILKETGRCRMEAVSTARVATVQSLFNHDVECHDHYSIAYEPP
jgi:hypothetical protein